MSLSVPKHDLGIMFYNSFSTIKITIFVQIVSYFNHKIIKYVLYDGIKF
jgi:hypothetical protein